MEEHIWCVSVLCTPSHCAQLRKDMWGWEPEAGWRKGLLSGISVGARLGSRSLAGVCHWNDLEKHPHFSLKGDVGFCSPQQMIRGLHKKHGVILSLSLLASRVFLWWTHSPGKPQIPPQSGAGKGDHGKHSFRHNSLPTNCFQLWVSKVQLCLHSYMQQMFEMAL